MVGKALGRAATGENFQGRAEVNFGKDYDVIEVQLTMTCDLFAMISSAAPFFFAKSLDSQKCTRSAKIARFTISALK